MPNLPAVDDLLTIDPLERRLVETRIRQTILRRKKQNIEIARRVPDIADWIEDNFYDPQFCKPNQLTIATTPKVKLEAVQKRILRHCFTINPFTGRFPYTTVVISKNKKSGKTTEGAAIGAWFAQNIEAPNVINVLAKDREQSSARVYAFMKPTLLALGARRGESKYQRQLPNGTIVQAITSDAEKEAGGTYGLTIWDELWAFASERERLLWDEMIPVLTRNISVRLVISYAGFKDSSDLLLSLYLSVFTDTFESELRPGVRIVDSLSDIKTYNQKGDLIPCCYEVPRIGLFYYNDHENRMPWQQGEKADQIRAEIEATGMLETNIYRLMENRWQETENRLLRPELLNASFKFKDSIKASHRMTFAIDAAMRHDCVALCGIYLKDDRYKTGYAKAWYPGNKNIDLEQTVMQEILSLYRAGLIHRRDPLAGEKKIVEEERLTCLDVWYDPYQMHQVMMNLRNKHRILIAEFGQSTERLKSDTFLLQKYQSYEIDNLDNTDLYSHLEAARAETQTDANELIRIIKGTGAHAKPIDLAVAQSMALWRCSKRPKTIALTGIPQGKVKGWVKR